jgi:SecD/SecF fusion protein
MAAAALLTGCGGATNADDDVVLVYRMAGGSGAPPAAALDATATVLRRRLARLGVAHVAVAREGGDALAVTLPDRATADRLKGTLGVPGLLRFYDWEADVLGPDGSPHPDDAAVTGGQAAGQPGAGSHTAARARQIAARARTRDAVLLQAEGSSGDKAFQALARDAFYVLADRPALTGSDLVDVAVAKDPTTGRPTVTFGFTAAGRTRWQAVTRRIARRGQAAVLPGVSSLAVAQHFAIALDDRLISIPYIDPQQNPDGIDGANGGQVSGGFTRAAATRLAALIAAGPLPGPLRLVDERPA